MFTSVFAGRYDVYAKSFSINDQGKIPVFFHPMIMVEDSYHLRKTGFQDIDELCFEICIFRWEIAIGIFPMQLQMIAAFLVLDLDEGDWKEAGLTIRRISQGTPDRKPSRDFSFGPRESIFGSSLGSDSVSRKLLIWKKLLELVCRKSMQLSF